MCTKEETTAIVAESEARIMATVKRELELFKKEIGLENQRVIDDTTKSHSIVSNMISDFGNELKQTTAQIGEFVKTYSPKIDDITIWRAVHESESKGVNEKIDNIQNNLNRIMWIVISGVVVALLGLVLN
jgi:hypothetical protein